MCVCLCVCMYVFIRLGMWAFPIKIYLVQDNKVVPKIINVVEDIFLMMCFKAKKKKH